MKLIILSLKEIIFEGIIEFINLPGYNGSFHILNNHGKLFSILKEGYIIFKVLKYFNGNYYEKYNKLNNKKNTKDNLIFKINEGLVEITDNNINILINK